VNDSLPQQYQEPAAQSSTSALVLDPNAMHSMMSLADIMSKAVASIPNHFRGKPGDCLAIVMQAMQWRMNPYAIAQKTHLTQSGALGYEAQLISAVITSCGALVTQPDYEFLGDWSKILGKVTEKTSEKGGKYYVAAWKPADEEGLGVIVRARLRGEKEPRALTVMMTQAYPRFSTQWATDPQQQITYLAVRKFGRRYAPGAILGVYTPDELEDAPLAGAERDITPQTVTATIVEDPEAAKKAAADAAILRDLLKRLDDSAKGGLAGINALWKELSPDQRRAIPEANWVAAKERAQEADKPVEVEATKPTYAQIMAQINAAAEPADLAEVMGQDLSHLTDQMQSELIATGQAKAARMGATP